jgi:hypothetical protein
MRIAVSAWGSASPPVIAFASSGPHGGQVNLGNGPAIDLGAARRFLMSHELPRNDVTRFSFFETGFI